MSRAELEAGIEEIRRSPSDGGGVELIVRRPAEDVREVLAQAELDPSYGLGGDTWRMRGSSSTPDGSANPDAQVTLMNVRAAGLFAVDPQRRQLAGDQLYVDLDLSTANIPAHTRLVVGTAVIEITAKPHTGCAKFAARFGRDALRFVNSPVGRELRLRGVNAKVVTAGVVRTGDPVRKLSSAVPAHGPHSRAPAG